MDERDWLAERFEEHRRPPAGGGLPDARLADRGRRRGPGGVAAAQPRGHERRREPPRLADDRRRARVPEHAARAQARGARIRSACTCPTRSSSRAGRRRPRAARRCWPTRSASRCSSCSRRCTRAERLAFVLHDMFAVPFDEIAPIVGRSPEAARQLASRARRRVQRRTRAVPTPTWPASARSSTRSSPPRATATSRRWSRCSTRTSCCARDAGRRRGRTAGGPRRRDGCRPGAWLRAPRARRAAGARQRRDRDACRRARRPPFSVGGLTVRGGRIVEIDILADPERLSRLDLTILDG